MAVEVALEVPAGSLDFWGQRLSIRRALEAVETRFGERVLPLVDPHGCGWRSSSRRRRSRARSRRGTRARSPRRASDPRLHGRTLLGARARADGTFLTDVLGFTRLGSEDGWTRYGFDGRRPGVVDVREAARRPPRRVGRRQPSITWRGAWTTRRISSAVRAQVEAAGIAGRRR